MGDGSPFPVTGNKLLALIKKNHADRRSAGSFEMEHRDRNIVRIAAGDPSLVDETFQTESELLKIAGRTVVALGTDVVADYRIEDDPDHGGYKMVFDLKN